MAETINTLYPICIAKTPMNELSIFVDLASTLDRNKITPHSCFHSFESKSINSNESSQNIVLCELDSEGCLIGVELIGFRLRF